MGNTNLRLSLILPSAEEMKSLMSLFFERSQLVGTCDLLELTICWIWGEIVLRHRCKKQVKSFNYGLEVAALNKRVFDAYCAEVNREKKGERFPS